MGTRLDAYMLRVECFCLSHHRPQDVSVLVGQRHGSLLPARSFAQRRRPLRGRIAALVRAHHRRFRTLDQEAAQVVVAALG